MGGPLVEQMAAEVVSFCQEEAEFSSRDRAFA